MANSHFKLLFIFLTLVIGGLSKKESFNLIGLKR